VALDHDLASVNRRSVPRPKRAPIRLPRFAHTQDLIKKLKSEKQALELELSHGHKSPIAKPSAPPQKIVLKSRVSHIDSRKKERELKNLLHQQDVLETKMSAFDQQDDPAIQAVFAEHFARNPVCCYCLFLGFPHNLCFHRVFLTVSQSRHKMYLVHSQHRIPHQLKKCQIIL
jgi:hypothetical protein